MSPGDILELGCWLLFVIGYRLDVYLVFLVVGKGMLVVGCC